MNSSSRRDDRSSMLRASNVSCLVFSLIVLAKFLRWSLTSCECLLTLSAMSYAFSSLTQPPLTAAAAAPASVVDYLPSSVVKDSALETLMSANLGFPSALSRGDTGALSTICCLTWLD